MSNITRYTFIGLIGLLLSTLAYQLISSRKSIGKVETAVVQSHRSYQVEVLSNTTGIKPQEPRKVVYKIKNDKGDILKNYEVAHQKIMHFIVVRKDLQNFQHLHPEFNRSSGEFTVSVTFPTDGTYRMFPDFTPGDDNPQKLPVTVYSDINVGDLKNYEAQAIIPDKQPNKTVGEYEISYSIPAILEQQKEASYTLIVSQNGQPVANLDKYLDARGHSVILKADTLDFIHTHALEGMTGSMSGMDHDMGAMSNTEMMQITETGPEIKFTTTFPTSGTYKFFTQFQHLGKVMTSDYTVQVNN